MRQQNRNIPECTATLRIGDGCIEFYREMSTERLQAMVEALRSC